MEPALSLIPLLKQNIPGASAGGFETCNLSVLIPHKMNRCVWKSPEWVVCLQILDL